GKRGHRGRAVDGGVQGPLPRRRPPADVELPRWGACAEATESSEFLCLPPALRCGTLPPCYARSTPTRSSRHWSGWEDASASAFPTLASTRSLHNCWRSGATPSG